jgi:hypothetical protein
MGSIMEGVASGFSDLAFQEEVDAMFEQHKVRALWQGAAAAPRGVHCSDALGGGCVRPLPLQPLVMPRLSPGS